MRDAFVTPLILALAGLAAGAALWWSGIDVWVHGWLEANYHAGFNEAMRALGDLGKGTTQAVACLLAGALLWWRGRKAVARVWLWCVPTFLLAGAVNIGLKFIIGRPRPKEVMWNGADPYTVHPFTVDAGFWSFPSGHAVSTFAIATVLAVAFPRWRGWIVTAAVVLAASRFLALTPHYLSDVIAGAAVGTAVALAVVNRVKLHA